MQAPFCPKYNSGQTVTPSSSSAVITIDYTSKQVCLTNTGAAICYVRISTETGIAATTADYPVPAGSQVTVTKNEGQATLAYISAAGTTLHVICGEGW